MTTHKEALAALVHEMEYVLSCINADKVPFDGDDFHEALRLGKEALAQPEQEPDVYIPSDALRQLKGTSLLILRSVPLYGYRGDGLTPLYTTPPQRKPLTDEEIESCIHHVDEDGIGLFAFARAIEAAHGIKE